MYAQSDIHLKRDNEKAVDGKDDEDGLVELSTLVATKSRQLDLPTKYKFIGDGIVNNERWDKTIEVKKSEREKSNIKESRLDIGEIGMDEVCRSEQDRKE